MVYMMMDLKVDREGATTKTLSKNEKFNIRDIVSIIANPAYIFIALLCVTFYSAVFPFLAFAPDFFMNKYSMTTLMSGRITSLLPLGTLFFTPLFGIFVDRKGRSATMMIFGALILLVVHLLFALTSVQPYILMIMLGIAFSLVPAAMWPSMVKLVHEKQIGTAYGLMYSIQNLGLWGVPLLAGIILDRTNPGDPEILNYTPTILMFAGLGLAGLIFAFALKIMDGRKNYGVDLPLNKKKA